jgi:DNA-binding response OmpR family regulator
MQKLPTNEFLAKKLGLIRGNPFAETQAEDEEQLPKYFVDLPAFYQVLDVDMGKPRSSILSASRGCGKSANRRNVERWLKHGPKRGYKGKWVWEPPVLVVSYTDFSRLKKIVGGEFSKIQAENHVDAVLWFCVSSLLDYLVKIWDKGRPKEISNWIFYQLGYFLVNYSDKWASLGQAQPNSPPDTQVILNQDINSFLHTACSFWKNAEQISKSGASGLLNGFTEVARAFGIKEIAILVDGIDELDQTANDPKMGALLLKSLIAERALMQIDGFYFKFFFPSEVVFELMQMPETRLGDKISVSEMVWDEAYIKLLLAERLKAFSNGTLRDLGQITHKDVKNINNILTTHVNNNPRNLLKLCNFLLAHLEQSITSNQPDGKKLKPKITDSIIDSAIKSFENDLIRTSSYSMPVSKRNEPNIPLFSAHGWEITHDLKVIRKGEIINQKKLDPKEYEILCYLIEHAGQMVKRDELGKAVWKEKWVSKYDWVLNQTILRLRKKIGHQRIETIRGLGYKFHLD